MIDIEKTYERFCEALPKEDNLSEEKKQNLFELMLRISYNYIHST